VSEHSWHSVPYLPNGWRLTKLWTTDGPVLHAHYVNDNDGREVELLHENTNTMDPVRLGLDVERLRDAPAATKEGT